MSKDLMNHIASQLDKLDTKLDAVDKTLIKQEENLREHMRRTELLEERQESFRSEVHEELRPIKSHVDTVKGVLKFIAAAIPILAAIAGAVYKYLI